MGLVSVNCNHCGASLKFPSKTKFVTCNYCQSQLKVESSGSAFYTEEILEEVREVADDVETIKLQNKLERLDREWEMKLKGFMVRNQQGHESLPTSGGSAVGMIIAIVGGVGWMVFTSNMGAPAFFPLFGLIFIGVGVMSGISGGSKAQAYEAAKHQYELKRQQIVRELNKRQ